LFDTIVSNEQEMYEKTLKLNQLETDCKAMQQVFNSYATLKRKFDSAINTIDNELNKSYKTNKHLEKNLKLKTNLLENAELRIRKLTSELNEIRAKQKNHHSGLPLMQMNN
jgi:hypothetical protein